MKRIRKALEMRHMKQKELAQDIGITETTLSRYINGTRHPDSEIIVRICKSLNVSADWLLELI